MKRYLLAAALLSAPPLAFVAPAGAAESKLAETDEYVKKARVELDALDAKIDALEIKAKEAGAEAKAGLDKKLKSLKAHRKTARKDFAKLKRASGKAWNDLKAGVDKSIADIKKELGEN